MITIKMSTIIKYVLKFFILSTLLILVKTELTCRFEDNTFMFHSCNATGPEDNVLHRGLVSDRRKTFHLIMNQCRISSIDLEAFYRLPALVILDLSKNKIQQLESGVFDRIPKLQRLELAYNLLTELSPTLFQHVSELSELDLEGNQLKLLDPAIFDKVPRLYRIDIAYNKFDAKDLGVDFLRRNRGLSILSLSGNNMIEADFLNEMTNLNYLYMDRCLFKVIPNFIMEKNMRQLRHLSLSENEISRIDNESTFNNLVEVMALNLTRNVIEFIHENTFKPLISLEELYLSHNRLHTIPVRMFQNIHRLYAVDLSFNLLTDISPDAFSETVLKRLYFNKNKISYLRSNFLVKLEDAGVMLRVIQFSGNPWQCACLRDLLQETKELEISYDDSTFNGQNFVCITNKDFLCKRNETSSLQLTRMFMSYNDETEP